MTKDEYTLEYVNGVRITKRFLVSRDCRKDYAEDFAQSGWIRGWEKIHQFRGESSLLSWVNTIALNLFRRHARTNILYNAGTLDLKVVFPDTLNDLMSEVDCAKVMAVSDHEDRKVLQAHYLEGIKLIDIASMAGETDSAVRIRLFRARERTRIRLGGRCRLV